jgi:hypothetical protein
VFKNSFQVLKLKGVEPCRMHLNQEGFDELQNGEARTGTLDPHLDVIQVKQLEGFGILVVCQLAI